MTTGDLLDAVLQYYLNQGSSTVIQDSALRRRAWFASTRVAKRVFNAAPNWWRKGDSSVVLTAGVGTMPLDFADMGTQGQIYVSGVLYRALVYRPPDWMKFQIQNNVQTGQPWAYSLYSQESIGTPKILCWPQDGSTILLKAYDKKTPELIDHPLSPNVAVGAVGALTGAYSYKVTFVTASGETEGGFVSANVSPVAQKIEVSDIPTWWGRTVTSRKLYRTAAGGLQHKLVATIADNLTTTYSDNNLDGTLGVNVPLPDAAVSGLEVFPSEFHESALYEGMEFLMARSQGDNRDLRFSAEWDRQVQRLWEETQQGQGDLKAFPPFPGGMSGHPVWSRFGVPS
jgi:hypothetical protein